MNTAQHLPPPLDPELRLQRWRMVLGREAENTCGSLPHNSLRLMDQALSQLYSPDSVDAKHRLQRGGRGASNPAVALWLGDIRNYFPKRVVQVMQNDALERLELQELLLDPEVLEHFEADIHLVANLMALSSAIPDATKDTARMVVRKVVDELLARLQNPLRSAISGALDRSRRNRRPRHAEIDWNRTLRANLRHWQEEYRTVIPETLIGYGRKSRKTQREVILCIDQSGSMANSIVYASIFGAVMASLPTVATRLVVFDTAVVDLTEQLQDPVDILFGVQLGGGTDINQAVGYCQSLIREPRDTIFVLISDLYEGGVESGLLQRTRELVGSGVQFITLLALSDEGPPCYDRQLGMKLAALGVPTFACTPDAFPELMASAIRREDVALWASKAGMVTMPAAQH